jgi:DNA primase
MGRIPEDIIRQVIERADIVDVVSAYIPLKKAGRNFKALSPFRTEKTPSFIVSPDKQIFHCFSSGNGGNVVTFVMKMEHMEFPEAVRFLAQRIGIEIPQESQAAQSADNIRQQIFTVNELAVQFYHEQLLTEKSVSAKTAREYLKQRDISLETVQKFRLGFALDKWDGLLNYLRAKSIPLSLMDKAGLIIPRKGGDGYFDCFRDRIIFPIFDTRSHCRAFGARSLDKDNPAKYINSPETPIYTKGHHLYGFNLARQAVTQQDQVVIVEGYIDCIMPQQSGVNNVVASLGTALTVEQVRLLGRYTKNIVMLFDADSAGQSAMLRSLDMLIEEGMDVRVANLAEGEDPDSYIRKFGIELFREKLQEANSLFEFKFNALKEKYGDKSIEGKAKIVAEMIPTIIKFSSAVLKEGYVQQLAKGLLIPDRAVWQEVEKMPLEQTRKNSFQELAAASVIQESIRGVEKDILKLVLSDSEYVSPTKGSVALENFQDKRVRAIMTVIYELSDKGVEVSVSGLMQSLRDQALQQIVSELVAEDEGIPGDKDKMHRDYLNRLRTDRLKTTRKQLLDQIRDAELAGDQERLEQLKELFNQVLKG